MTSRRSKRGGGVAPAPAAATMPAVPPFTQCSYDGCDASHYSGGWCSGHYAQRRRGEDLRPLRTRRGYGTRVNVSMPRDLRDAVRAAAGRESTPDEPVNENEWIRRAILERLERRRVDKT